MGHFGRDKTFATLSKNYFWPKMSMYKRRGALLYPFTCARAVGAAPTATPSRAGEVNQGKTKAQDSQSNAKTKNAKDRETKQVPSVTPASPFAGAARQTPTGRATLEPTSPTPSATWGQGSGGTSVVACRSL